MRIAVVSDLHLIHWRGADKLHVLIRALQESFEKEKPDLIIDCGDLELPEIWESCFPQYKTFFIPGNHDYYLKEWIDKDLDCKFLEYNGLNIIGCTLWTDFNNNDPSTHFTVGRAMNDFYLIENFSTNIAYEAHLAHKKFLEKAFKKKKEPIDIVVTHHPPSLKSVCPRYEGNPINPGFVSDLDWLVEKSNAKYWLFGHTHWEHDYKIGNTECIGHPCGYPRERTTQYLPRYIDI